MSVCILMKHSHKQSVYFILYILIVFRGSQSCRLSTPLYFCSKSFRNIVHGITFMQVWVRHTRTCTSKLTAGYPGFSLGSLVQLYMKIKVTLCRTCDYPVIVVTFCTGRENWRTLRKTHATQGESTNTSTQR